MRERVAAAARGRARSCSATAVGVRPPTATRCSASRTRRSSSPAAWSCRTGCSSPPTTPATPGGCSWWTRRPGGPSASPAGRAHPRTSRRWRPPGRARVWVGDIGDNCADRASGQRHPAAGRARSTRRCRAQTYELTYPARPRDAESLLADPRSGRLLVASKSIFGGALYAAPRAADRRRRRTGCASSATCCRSPPTGRSSPTAATSCCATTAGRSSTPTPGSSEVAELDLPEQQQGEAIAVDDDGRVYVSSEGRARAGARGAAARRRARRGRARRRAPSAVAVAARGRPPAPARARSCPRRSRGGREPWQWLLGTAARVGAVAVLVRRDCGRARRAGHPSGCSTASPAQPQAGVRAAPPEDLARRAGLDEEAGRAGASSTSTSTASGCPTTRPSGCATW